MTDGGTVTVGLLDDRVTVVAPRGEALDSETVQVVLALEPKLEASHCRAERLLPAISDSMAE
jgi:hypothetical protein